jgi:hypothetical protein
LAAYQAAQPFSAKAEAKDARWSKLNDAIGILISAWSAEVSVTGSNATDASIKALDPYSTEGVALSRVQSQWSSQATAAETTLHSECAVVYAVTGGRPMAKVAAAGPTTTVASTTTTAAPTTTIAATTTSVAPTTTVPPPTNAAAGFAGFVGQWYYHGMGGTIEPNGSGMLTWRIYKWCSQDPTAPCDQQQGDQIINGGNASFHITSVNGSSGYVHVDQSTDPADLPVGNTIFVLLPGDHLKVPGFQWPLCGPAAPAGTCGA